MIFMSREYFYLSEIILGLREEYNKTKEELDEIKNMMSIDPEYDASLGIYSKLVPCRYDGFERHNMLVIELERKKKDLNKLIEAVSKKISKKDLPKEFACDSEWNKSFLVVDKPNKYSVDNQKDFQAHIDNVLHTEFNLGALDTYRMVEDANMAVKAGHNGVFCITDSHKKFAPNTGFDYYASDDQIVLNNYYSNPLFKDAIDEVMRTPIPRSVINYRLANIIENNPKSYAKLAFEGLTNTRVPQHFQLIEEPGRVLAKRI